MNDAKTKLIPALAAVGGSLAAGQALALEIGPITVQSTLGEPLRASIAYALGPNETLADYCVSLRRAAPGAGVPSISRATISVDKGLITISGATALREPIATVRLDVSCPYTPKLSREYTLMIDPGGRSDVTGAVPAAVLEPAPAAAAAEAVTATPPAERERAATLPPLEPLAAGDRVYVEPGLTLSRIVAAVEDRAVDGAEAAHRIVAANPSAFIDADPNRLEAGSWLSIPDLADDAPVTDRTPEPVNRAAEPRPVAGNTRPDAQPQPDVANTPPAPALDNAEPKSASPAIAAQAPSTAGQEGPVAPDVEPPPAEALTQSAPNAGVIDDTEFLEPAAPPATADAGDGEAAAADTLPQSDVAANTDVAAEAGAPQATATREVAGTTISAAAPAQSARSEPDSGAGTSSFWYWLIGGGAALIAGLLTLLYRGRRTTDPALPERVRSQPNPLMERVKQAEGIEVEPIQAFTTPDFNLGDDSPTAENPTLDTGPASARGFDDDGALAADLDPAGDQHAHQDVDINLGAVRYEDSADPDSRADHARESNDDVDPAVVHSDTASDEVDVDLSSGGTAEHDDDVDVDLASGTGFDAGQHTPVDENFTFAATTALDFELPEENEPSAPQPKTDVIPPLNIEESSILKSEVLPEDDSDDYDMSVILDATKQPDPREVTEKDLHAVVVDAGDATLNSGEYTVSRDSEFELLEQDYEDELSATQALNMEIERAALDLAGRMGEDPATAEAEAAADTDDLTDVAGLDDDPEAELTEELPTHVAAMVEDDEPATDIATLDAEAPTAIASLDEEEAATDIATFNENEEPATDVALLDDETMDAVFAEEEEEGPTAVAPLEEDDGPPTAILDDDTVDAAVAATEDEQPTAIAPLDEDEEPVTDFSPLDQTSIESQLAHLPGEGPATAANDDPLPDEDIDPTGITATLKSEITEEDKTVEMSTDVEEPTIRLSRDADDDTVEIPPRSKNA